MEKKKKKNWTERNGKWNRKRKKKKIFGKKIVKNCKSKHKEKERNWKRKKEKMVKQLKRKQEKKTKRKRKYEEIGKQKKIWFETKKFKKNDKKCLKLEINKMEEKKKIFF